MTTPLAGLPPPQPTSPCPCGSGQTFAACCGPLLAGERSAATAEQLMRSRFTAHVARDFGHLHRTCLATVRQPYVEDADAPKAAWTRLVIRSHEPAAKPDTAYVDFTAYYLAEDNSEQPMHEKSEFRRVDGTWFFVRPLREGPAPVRSAHPKVGRNDPCPCGSGRKYKHCCLPKG